MFMERPLSIYDKRLLKLAAFLRNHVPEKLLNMGLWVDIDRKGHKHKHANLNCETPACALGWATAIFPELSYNWTTHQIVLKGKTKAIQRTVKEFFNVEWGDNYSTGVRLFGPFRRTPEEEAQIIEQFVAGRRLHG